MLKLASFSSAQTGPGTRLGVVTSDSAGDERLIPVDLTLPDGRRITDMSGWIAAHPDGADALTTWLDTEPESIPLSGAMLETPLSPVAALMDAGAAPRHLRQAAVTLFSRSLPAPIRPVARPVINAVAGRVLGKALSEEALYDQRRPSSVTGSGVEIPWPPYTSFVDIEPELAIVVADVPLGADERTAAAQIVGYTVYNDVSARDVQLKEMVGAGMALSKDMDSGNVLGPWLVTPDEVPDPLDLAVTVTTDQGRRWVGTTADYSMSPAELVSALARHQSLTAGTVIGMGTVADTCGLERDEWLEPGESVTIEIAGIGALHQRLGTTDTLDTRRWGGRRPVRAPS